MEKFHGTPITPKEVFELSMIGKNCLIPWFDPRDLFRALEICNKVIIDNSAYSIHNSGKKVNWNDFYEWIQPFKDKIEFFFIPDVIDGTEKENNLLINDYFNRNEKKGVPVWHVDESIDRLEYLMSLFDYIAIGSSGEYWELNTYKWNRKMDLAMRTICDENGKPKVKIHMLRCLKHEIFLKYPFYSGDSTNLAQNHSTYNSIQRDSKKGILPSNDGWKIVLRNTEKYNSPKKYKFRTFYTEGSLF